jgi:hypothetical protein
VRKQTYGSSFLHKVKVPYEVWKAGKHVGYYRSNIPLHSRVYFPTKIGRLYKPVIVPLVEVSIIKSENETVVKRVLDITKKSKQQIELLKKQHEFLIL